MNTTKTPFFGNLWDNLFDFDRPDSRGQRNRHRADGVTLDAGDVGTAQGEIEARPYCDRQPAAWLNQPAPNRQPDVGTKHIIAVGVAVPRDSETCA